MADIPKRKFGKADAAVSCIGFGGHHIGDAQDVKTAVKLIHQAVDAGITFFDNCWEYHRGKTEDWMGQGLKGRRDKVFLMTKVCTHGRDADLAMRMLEQSLNRFRPIISTCGRSTASRSTTIPKCSSVRTELPKLCARRRSREKCASLDLPGTRIPIST